MYNITTEFLLPLAVGEEAWKLTEKNYNFVNAYHDDINKYDDGPYLYLYYDSTDKPISVIQKLTDYAETIPNYVRQYNVVLKGKYYTVLVIKYDKKYINDIEKIKRNDWYSINYNTKVEMLHNMGVAVDSEEHDLMFLQINRFPDKYNISNDVQTLKNEHDNVCTEELLDQLDFTMINDGAIIDNEEVKAAA
jgi:hypothetical protein